MMPTFMVILTSKKVFSRVNSLAVNRTSPSSTELISLDDKNEDLRRFSLNSSMEKIELR